MSTIFDFISKEIERRTDLGRLEARGTVRLALKEAGFDAESVTARHMTVVLERVMPDALTIRGVPDSAAICKALATSLQDFKQAVEAQGKASPESVFARLAGR